MPTEREKEIENALGPIRDKLGFVADSLERCARSGEKLGDPLPVALLIRDLDQQIHAEVVKPMYEQRDQVGLQLGEEEVRELIVDLYKLSAAAAYGENEHSEERELRNCLVAISLKVPRIVEDIERSTCMEISAQERDAIYVDAGPWGDKALSEGRHAVEEVES